MQKTSMVYLLIVVYDLFTTFSCAKYIMSVSDPSTPHYILVLMLIGYLHGFEMAGFNWSLSPIICKARNVTK